MKLEANPRFADICCNCIKTKAGLGRTKCIPNVYFDFKYFFRIEIKTTSENDKKVVQKTLSIEGNLCFTIGIETGQD